MLKMEVKTKKDPTTVVQKIKEYFGEGNLGLELKSETPYCLNFEGGGGFVTADLCTEDGVTQVALETREWEYHVKKMALKIH